MDEKEKALQVTLYIPIRSVYRRALVLQQFPEFSDLSRNQLFLRLIREGLKQEEQRHGK